MLSGCLGTRHLKEGEKLLVKQQVVNTTRDIDMEDVNQLYVQRKNRRLPLIPFAPYVSLYYAGLRDYDPEKYQQKINAYQEKYNAKIQKVEDKPKKVAKLERRKRKKVEKMELKIEEGNNGMRWGEELAIFDLAMNCLRLDTWC